MKERTGGVHSKLNKLLSIIGGYDYKYHAVKIAKEYDLETEDIIRIMEISETKKPSMTKGLFNSYLSMLRDGFPISDIVQKERERSTAALNRLTGYSKYMANIVSRAIYNGR